MAPNNHRHCDSYPRACCKRYADLERQMDISKTVQVALLGEVPATLRFLYVSHEGNDLYFHAVFTDDATEDHIESANCVLTEVSAACPLNTKITDKIEKNSLLPWKINNGENLMYLRYGELDNA